MPHTKLKVYTRSLPWVFLLFLLFPLNALGWNTSPKLSTSFSRVVPESVEAIYLQTIRDGVLRTEIMAHDDPIGEDPVTIKGHVTGVVVICEKKMDIRVNGVRMNPIRKNDDGTYSIKFLGTLEHDEFLSRFGKNTYYQGNTGRKIYRNSIDPIQGYSFFPRIPGDSISASETFDLTFKIDGGDVFQLAVRHHGYREIGLSGKIPGAETGDIGFQYLGTRLDPLQKEKDFIERIGAITAGIRSVEKTFRTDLIDLVRIIDYDGVRNAFTCQGNRNIWLYTKAFLEEPVEELKTIAEHEALHILVDQKEFSMDTRLREHFASLKGYRDLSMERFLLVTRGVVSSASSDREEAFFDFINEKNFISGMKGGHSHQNLAEFCTSFLHSLMYLNRLRDNLSNPLTKSQNGTWVYLLSEKEQTAVLKSYIQTLDILIASIELPGSDPVYTFMMTCREHASKVLESPRQDDHRTRPSA